MKIYDFNDETKYPLSNRDGIYIGNGVTKDGVLIVWRILVYQVS